MSHTARVPAQPGEHVDVLVVGAGISGIAAAHHLLVDTPGKTFAVLEARDVIGGTWDLFRYPGVRSDSDLFTFGFAFRPWRDEDSIASGEKILQYLNDTVDEEGIGPHIQFGSRVVEASWSTPQARWDVTVEDVATGERRQQSATWIFAGTGYYRYDQGFIPDFAGLDDFGGQVIHPQHWPADADLSGKKVVVIGSGATAVTLVPALAKTAAHVTMLQRTPTYVMPLPTRDRFAVAARKVLGDDRGHAVTRYKNALMQRVQWVACQKYPDLGRKVIRAAQVKVLPEGYPVDVHFNPPYNPWDQRVCAVPDGDMFKALRGGNAEIVTDTVARFTETGIEFGSGGHLDADVVVTATGFTVQPFGDIAVTVDGDPFAMADHVAYRGLMLDGLPNFAFAIGYTNASWTLKVSLLCEYFVRVLKHLDANGLDWARPTLPEAGLETRPLLDFGAGYVQRALDDLPKQGTQEPWTMSMNWFADRRILGKAPIADGNLRFGRRAPAVAGSHRAEVDA